MRPGPGRDVNDRGGPYAFPLSADEFYDRGMSLRDYLAAAAVPLVWRLFEVAVEKGAVPDGGGPTFVAAEAYKVADAMLAERAKGPPPAEGGAP